MSSLTTRRRWLRIALAGLALVGASWIAASGLRAYGHASRLRSLAGELAAAAGQAESLDVSAIRSQVSASRAAAEGLQAELRLFRPLTDRLGWVPRFGPMLEAAGPAVDYAAGLTAGADELLAVFDPLLAEGGRPAGQGSSGESLLAALEQGEPHLRAAGAAMESASRARATLDLDALPASLAEPLRRLDPLLPLARPAIEALERLPDALGSNEPRTYLLLAQNQDELRATGGFISGVGEVTLDRGAIAGFSIVDSYAVDDLSQPYPAPPEALQRYMDSAIWLLRDANWSPDFPTSGRTALDLYALSTGTWADGVIAFDQTAIERALAVLGPIQLPNVDQPVSAENVGTFMRLSWGSAPGGEVDPEWWLHRKDFMGSLGKALLDRALRLDDPHALAGLLRAAYQLLREKHVLVYFADDGLESIVQAMDLDASVRPGDGDFLMVVDSNVGFNKVDARIERRITYSVNLSNPDQPAASLRLDYAHTYPEPVPCVHAAIVTEAVYESLQERCLWDYFRVLVPEGSQVTSSYVPAVPGDWLLTGTPEHGDLQAVEGETGVDVYGGIFVLPPGRQMRVSLDYVLPAGVVAPEPDGTMLYALHIAKQPGTLGTPVRVDVRIPAETQTDSPRWTALGDGWFRWEGQLWVDHSLSLRLIPADR